MFIATSEGMRANQEPGSWTRCKRVAPGQTPPSTVGRSGEADGLDHGRPLSLLFSVDIAQNLNKFLDSDCTQ